jgi:hypothetical protein
VIEAKAAASSTTERNICASQKERTKNIIHFLFSSKQFFDAAVGDIKKGNRSGN